MTSPTRGLYLLADGTWLHDGDRVEHARLAALLHRSIARAADGTFIVTTGRDILPMACEDTPLRVLRVVGDADGPVLVFSNEKEAPLDPGLLSVDGDGSLRTEGPGGLPARFTRAAQLQLEPFLVARGDDVLVRVGDREVLLARA